MVERIVPRANKEVYIGGGLVLGGVTIAGVSALQNKEAQEIAHPTPQAARDFLIGLPIQEVAKDIISQYMTPYLSWGHMSQLSQMIRRCEDIRSKSGITPRLLVWGLPHYDNKGKMDVFVPRAFGCSTINRTSGPYAPQEGFINAPDLIHKLSLISKGLQKNTTVAGSADEVSTESFPNSVNFAVPSFQFNDDGFIEDPYNQEVLNYEPIGTDQDFVYNVVQLVKSSSVCGFPSLRDAQYTIDAVPHIYGFKDDNNEAVILGVCSRETTQSTGPTEIDFNRLSPKIRRQIGEFIGTPFSLTPDSNGRIAIRTPNGDGTFNIVVLYNSGKNGQPQVTSEIIAYRQKDLAMEKPGNSQALSGSFLGWAVMVAGGVTFFHGTIRAAKEAAYRKVNNISKEIQPRTVVQKPKPKSAVNGGGFVMTETRPAATPFTLDFGDQSVLIIRPQDEILPKLQALTDNDEIKNRLRRNREDFIELFSAISKYRGDFSAIKGIVKDRKRFSEIHIGGDSATVSYKISAGNDVLGWLLIDANMEENEVLVELWDEEPKIPAIEVRRSSDAMKTTIFEADDTQNKAAYTVDQIANNIIEDIHSEKIQQYGSDSRVKKEVVRKLAQKIASNQIPVYEKDVKIKNTYKEYARIIAARLYDYISGETPTSAEEFESFTQAAKNLLDQMGFVPLPQTAAKSWATRTGFRIQIVQTENAGLGIFFTSHGH